jgi:hypothetical protein
MIVPFPKGQVKGTAPQAQPSETDMLMALATMHQMGRITPPSAPAELKQQPATRLSNSKTYMNPPDA